MFTATLTTDSGAQLTLESERVLDMASFEVGQLLQSLERARLLMGLLVFDFRLVSGTLFGYQLETRNGRIWRQKLDFDVPADPMMTFDVAQGFRVSEFAAQRDLRACVIACVTGPSQLRRMTAVWP